MVEEAERALDGWRMGARAWTSTTWTRTVALRVAMRALFGFDPDRAGVDGRMAEAFERGLSY